MPDCRPGPVPPSSAGLPVQNCGNVQILHSDIVSRKFELKDETHITFLRQATTKLNELNNKRPTLMQDAS